MGAVKMAKTVYPVHWSLWAIEERCPGEGLALGYPTQTPEYTPARRSKESDDPPPATITAHDRRVARLIAVSMRMMLVDRSEDRRLLRTYHGAHPGASPSREERMADCRRITGKGESATRNRIRRAEQYVEGWVAGAIEYAQLT